MYLDCAVFENYRNIVHFPFTFDRNINILYGKNAQGKTNVIEGIYFFGSGKSFRHAREKDLIKTGENYSQISIAYVDSVRENKMSVRIFRDLSKEMFKNGIKIGRVSKFIGNFRAVLFCPEHLSIIKSDPSERRGFLDHAISQINPIYLASLMEHKKILEQRNALLKSETIGQESFHLTAEILSEKLAQSAAVITQTRAKYLKRLFELVNQYMQQMTNGREYVDVHYLSHIGGEKIEELFDRENNTEKYRKIFSKDIKKELLIGTTIGGAHRDDFEIRLLGMNAKIFASQGQQRSIALAMKLAEGEISKEESGEYPVFLFDDVLSELDKERKNFILSELSGRQVIITTCNEEDFKGIDYGKKIFVENGTYQYQ